MGTLERLVLRMADWDGTWWGLGWLRPARDQRVSVARFALTSFVLSAPGAVAGLGLIWWGVGCPDPVFGLAVFAGLMLVQVVLNLPWAYFWNRRAATLARSGGDLAGPSAPGASGREPGRAQ